MFPDEKAVLKNTFSHQVYFFMAIINWSYTFIVFEFILQFKKSFKNLGVSSSVNLAKKGNINVKIIQIYLMIHCFFLQKR